MGFIKNKIIGRTMLAFIAPSLIYSFGYLAYMPFNKNETRYFNKWSWITIAVFSIVWPISQISLWFLFSPIIWCLKKSVNKKYDKNRVLPFFEKANFVPVKNEIEYKINPDLIDGQVPQDIRGVFLKNGPNDQFKSDTGNSHWFDGDGMLHGVSITDDGLYFCNRYVRTNKYLQEKKAGKAVYTKLGELTGAFVMIMPLNMLMTAIGYKK